MPWKTTATGEVEFSGKIVMWMQEIQRRHHEFTSFRPDVPFDFNTYLMLVVGHYAILSKQKWEKDWFGKSKIEKLDSMVTTTPDGNIKFNVFDTLDFLAEKSDWLSDNFSVCHEFAKKQMGV